MPATAPHVPMKLHEPGASLRWCITRARARTQSEHESCSPILATRINRLFTLPKSSFGEHSLCNAPNITAAHMTVRCERTALVCALYGAKTKLPATESIPAPRVRACFPALLRAQVFVPQDRTVGPSNLHMRNWRDSLPQRARQCRSALGVRARQFWASWASFLKPFQTFSCRSSTNERSFAACALHSQAFGHIQSQRWHHTMDGKHGQGNTRRNAKSNLQRTSHTAAVCAHTPSQPTEWRTTLGGVRLLLCSAERVRLRAYDHDRVGMPMCTQCARHCCGGMERMPTARA